MINTEKWKYILWDFFSSTVEYKKTMFRLECYHMTWETERVYVLKDRPLKDL